MILLVWARVALTHVANGSFGYFKTNKGAAYSCFGDNYAADLINSVMEIFVLTVGE